MFSYDHMNNCEGFANSVMGFEHSYTAQGEGVATWCASLFCIVGCLCPFGRRSLAEAMKNRLKKKGLWDDAKTTWCSAN